MQNKKVNTGIHAYLKKKNKGTTNTEFKIVVTSGGVGQGSQGIMLLDAWGDSKVMLILIS